MAKDPAFLFYYQDFLVGTSFHSNEEVGAYIRILAHLADKKTLSEKHMINICNSQKVWNSLKEKFTLDENGEYFNERLRDEVQKRRKYTQSRRNNRKSKEHMNNISKTYDKHMENEDVDVNVVNTNAVDSEDGLNDLWRNVFLGNAGAVEKDFVKELTEKHGKEKAKRILYDLRENGFKKVRTMKDALDKHGNIKPRSRASPDQEQEFQAVKTNFD